MSKNTNNKWISSDDFEILFENGNPTYVSHLNNGGVYCIERFSEERDENLIKILEREGKL